MWKFSGVQLLKIEFSLRVDFHFMTERFYWKSNLLLLITTSWAKPVASSVDVCGTTFSVSFSEEYSNFIKWLSSLNSYISELNLLNWKCSHSLNQLTNYLLITQTLTECKCMCSWCFCPPEAGKLCKLHSVSVLPVIWLNLSFAKVNPVWFCESLSLRWD